MCQWLGAARQLAFLSLSTLRGCMPAFPVAMGKRGVRVTIAGRSGCQSRIPTRLGKIFATVAAEGDRPIWHTFGVENKLSFTCFFAGGGTSAFSRGTGRREFHKDRNVEE
jgi:hypothetical protein